MPPTSTGGGRDEQVLPVVGSSAAAGGDLARGRVGIALWGLPIAVILAGSALTSTHVGAARWDESLYVIGAAWLGGTCLYNARRCGRTHCWIVGVGLPILAAVGVVGVVGAIPLSWSSFGSAIWLVVLGAFVFEWVCGPYLGRRLSSVAAP